MNTYGYYTQSASGPLSWAGSRRGVQRQSEDNFKRHAAKFYKGRGKGKGLLSKIFGAIKKTGQNKPRRVMQRPGNIGLGQAELMPPPTEGQKQVAKVLMYLAIGFMVWMALGAPGGPKPARGR